LDGKKEAHSLSINYGPQDFEMLPYKANLKELLLF